MNFYTIGVYGSTEQEYFQKLIDNKVDVFCDIRQRRGVRGPKYAFVNSKRLQERLKFEGIKYYHIRDLAPTQEIREIQKVKDLENGALKRDRNTLGDLFVATYKSKVLNNFNFDIFLKQLESQKAKNIALFCVEEKHLACHRSIVSDQLKNLDYKIEQL
ncbi:hypothetical protein SPONL_895 [uncultured Candidatus Thioglobus sp.]|nr:hypothetical protein SPONL_895 [uncultured Candidatus Thioglobus sp.]